MKKRTAIAGLGVLLLGAGVLAQAPGWWASRGVVNPYRAARDYHPVNQGQLKHMVLRAYEEFHAKWPDAANAPILAQIDAFLAEGNHRPVNLGMLKHAAKPFYDRLIALGYATNYPWADGEPADFALANHGQLKNLFSFDLDAHDADANGIPDWWERLHFGSVTGAVASADNDGDGLSNLQEYQYGTDPERQDTSGDGITDGWAVQYGLNPTAPIGHLDANGDGLTNLENYLAGANPWSSDTNSDGFSDFLAVRIFHLDPTVAYFTGQRTTNAVMAGSAGAVVAGTWSSTPEGYIRARVRNGVIEYTLPVATSGVYAVIFEVEQYNTLTTRNRFDLSLNINGRYAGRQTVTAPHGAPAEALFATPWLEPGNHCFTLQWHNLNANTFLSIRRVLLVELGAYDVNENGVDDWIEYRQDDAFTHSEIASSPISPVCFEGTSGYRDSLTVVSSATEPEEIIEVRKGPHDLWYANVPLDPDQPTQVILHEAYVFKSSTQTVVWSETNLLPEPAEPMRIRKGDALRLIARPDGATNGTVEINIVGITNYLTSVDMPIPHTFDDAGEFTVNALWQHEGSSSNSTTMIEVVHVAFPGNPACVIGQLREWECPLLSTNNATLKPDLQTYVEQEPADGGGSILTIGILTDQSRHIMARMGEDGVILDSAQIIGINADNGSYWTIAGVMPDGSRIVEVQLAIGNVPPDLSVELKIFVGGVLFENGTLYLTLTAEDFDERGVATYRLIQAPESMSSVCHTTTFYDGDTSIGGN